MYSFFLQSNVIVPTPIPITQRTKIKLESQRWIRNVYEDNPTLVTCHALAVGFYESTKDIVSDSSANDDRKDEVSL